MSLRDMAEADLGFILNDDVTGFAHEITITEPVNGEAYILKGFSNDIHEMIDPDTGLVVSGRQASVAVRLRALQAAGLQIPRRVHNEASRPWIVGFNDVNGNYYTFNVREARPDYSLGCLVLILEAWGG